MGRPDNCVYHVWQEVQLNPGDPTLTTVCQACGGKRALVEKNKLIGRISVVVDVYSNVPDQTTINNALTKLREFGKVVRLDYESLAGGRSTYSRFE